MNDGPSLHGKIRALIARDGLSSDAEIEQLSLELFAWQIANNPTLARIAHAAREGSAPTTIDEIPAVPTDAFKVATIACFDVNQAKRVFRTSGTTQEVRGVHAFADTSLYEASCLRTGAKRLLPESQYQLVCLAQDETSAPDSSLSFMLARFAERWDPTNRHPFMVRNGALDVPAVRRSMESASLRGIPVAILGPSSGFIHLLDAVGDGRWDLPTGSVAMPTGGFKGRSRELSPLALRQALTEVFGLGPRQIIGEYGMTELSSQAYEAEADDGRLYRCPPWMRVTAVDPVSLERLPPGETGLLRIVDLANVWSAIAIQTSDIGRATQGGFEVLGRALDATPRGCARALDILLTSE